MGSPLPEVFVTSETFILRIPEGWDLMSCGMGDLRDELESKLGQGFPILDVEPIDDAAYRIGVGVGRGMLSCEKQIITAIREAWMIVAAPKVVVQDERRRLLEQFRHDHGR